MRCSNAMTIDDFLRYAGDGEVEGIHPDVGKWLQERLNVEFWLEQRQSEEGQDEQVEKLLNQLEDDGEVRPIYLATLRQEYG